jgi:hypothetical protein
MGMTDKEKLIMAEALGALRAIADTTDGYAARALAWAAIWSMDQIAKNSEPPTEQEMKDFLRSQGIQPGVTRAGGN